MLWTLLIPLMVGASILLIFLGLALPRPADQIQERLAEYGARPLSLEEIELSEPFTERVLKPMIRDFIRLFARLAPQRNIQTIRHKLDLAGNPYYWTPLDFLGIRGLVAIITGSLTFLLLTAIKNPLPNRLLLCLATGILGFYLPLLWLNRRIKARQKEILRALPDALDLLTICVEAGLGFDAAMSKVAEKWDNELARAFARTIAEIRMGKTRREALRDMSTRMDVPEVTSFVAAVIQADQLGVSIAKVLRIQSEQMRIKRRQRAEEEAHKAPIKMLLPLAFLIFPAIWIVLMGPAILTLRHAPVMGGG